MVLDAWQSTWVGDSTEWAHARARASRAGKFARRGKKGLGALAARNLGSRRLRRWETRREALCGQAGGPLPREVTRGRSMPGQEVGARHTKKEQVGRDRSRVGVRSTVATHSTPRKVGRGAGKAQTRACAATAAICALTMGASSSMQKSSICRNICQYVETPLQLQVLSHRMACARDSGVSRVC